MAGTLAEPILIANSALDALGEGTAATGSILEVTAPAGASGGDHNPQGYSGQGFEHSKGWMEKMLKFIPKTLAETMVDLGYDSQESLTSTVINMDDADQWIELILDSANLSSKIPKIQVESKPYGGQAENCVVHVL